MYILYVYSLCINILTLITPYSLYSYLILLSKEIYKERSSPSLFPLPSLTSLLSVRFGYPLSSLRSLNVGYNKLF